MVYDEEKDLFHYPCPCGDRFEITRQQLKDAEDVARCPSCSLIIRVVFDPIDFEDDDDDEVPVTRSRPPTPPSRRQPNGRLPLDVR